jgi:hypothetical protein
VDCRSTVLFVSSDSATEPAGSMIARNVTAPLAVVLHLKESVRSCPGASAVTVRSCCSTTRPALRSCSCTRTDGTLAPERLNLKDAEVLVTLVHEPNRSIGAGAKGGGAGVVDEAATITLKLRVAVAPDAVTFSVNE